MNRLLPLLVLPALALNLLTFVAPMVNLAGYAFHEALPGGGIGKALTLSTWTDLASDPYNWGLLTTTLRLSFEVTMVTLLCAYPIALFVHRANPRWRNLLVVACISPLLVSAGVRTYGWIIILGDGGGIIRNPDALYDPVAVIGLRAAGYGVGGGGIQPRRPALGRCPRYPVATEPARDFAGEFADLRAIGQQFRYAAIAGWRTGEPAGDGNL
jgi:hypothetical protein